MFINILKVIIPISLYVSVEIVKLGQVYFINHDREMFYEKSAQYPICRATNINEDLGQIQYVFSDKTGTLTENKMVFKRFSVAGVLGTHNPGMIIFVFVSYIYYYEKVYRLINIDTSSLSVLK